MANDLLFPVLIALLATACVLCLLLLAFHSRLSSHSESRRRYLAIAAQGVPGARRARPGDADRRRTIELTLRELDEKKKAKRGAQATLLVRMRQGGLDWSTRRYRTLCVVVGCASFLLPLAAFGIRLLPALAFGVAGGLLLPHIYVAMKRKRRFKAFTKEFPNAVDVIVRGVKAGLPLVDCLRIISVESQEPVRSEFRVIVEDQTLGLPVDQAAQRLPERIPLAETNFFAIVIALQSRTGGSLADALGNLSKVLRERAKMQAKIKAMSSEAKASACIIGAMPVVVAGLIYLTAPQYISLLFTTSLGKLVLAACFVWMAMGVLTMRKMVNFDF